MTFFAIVKFEVTSAVDVPSETSSLMIGMSSMESVGIMTFIVTVDIEPSVSVTLGCDGVNVQPVTVAFAAFVIVGVTVTVPA